MAQSLEVGVEHSPLAAPKVLLKLLAPKPREVKLLRLGLRSLGCRRKANKSLARLG